MFFAAALATAGSYITRPATVVVCDSCAAAPVSDRVGLAILTLMSGLQVPLSDVFAERPVQRLPLLTLGAHIDAATSVAYRPDGKHVASGGADGAVRVWDADGGKEVLAFSGHTAKIRSLVYSPDGRYVAAGCDDHTVKVWDVARLLLGQKKCQEDPRR